MLKTNRGEQTWFVTQPNHGAVAGYLAAHWGNDEFTAPGYFGTTADPAQLRAETILAIAEHDNGWWEWEAIPDFGELDALPLDLGDVLKDQQAGMDRWRRGIPQFGESHPYVSLLISFHAYWLYAARTESAPDPAFVHPLFWKGAPEKLMAGPLDQARAFVTEIRALQADLAARVRRSPATASWVDSDSLKPHARSLQVLDGLSLWLSYPLIPVRSGEAKGFGEDPVTFLEVPRGSWNDRVAIEARPGGNRRIILDPYPFDRDPLPVSIPVRIVDHATKPSAPLQAWWRSQQEQQIHFELSAL